MSREENPGFNRFNVIAMVEEGEAFVPASATRKIRDGDRVALIPFSHGG
jgi:molybdopterin converting factor small subunit